MFTETSTEIRFTNGFLANTHPAPITLRNPWTGESTCYPDTETAFHCAKATSRRSHDEILRVGWVDGWKQAKHLGRQIELRSDWETIKVKVMFNINRVKFKREEFQQQLLLTGTKTIIEARRGDSFWGIGPDGVVTPQNNHQGRVLMAVRHHWTHN